MRRIFALSLILLAPQIYAASTYLNLVDESTTSFVTDANDLQPFSSTMIFKWQTVSPDIKFNLDTAGNNWNLYFKFGMNDPRDNPPLPDNIKFWSYSIVLGGVEGDGFNIYSGSDNTYNNDPVPFLGIGSIWSSISGNGSFTSISFEVNFDDIPGGSIGVMMSPWFFPWYPTAPLYASTDRHSSSYFSINSGEDGGGSFSVPEPSALSLLALGLGGLAILQRRRS